MFSSEQTRDEDLTAQCDCRPCTRCEGEGGHNVYYVKDHQGHYKELVEPVWFDCDDCCGTGKDSDDCEVHGAVPVDAQLTIVSPIRSAA